MRDDFTKFSTICQWFQTLIYPALMQRLIYLKAIVNITSLRRIRTRSKTVELNILHEIMMGSREQGAGSREQGAG
ncbi:MAG: hypothetical protein HRU34_24370, partial [Richelia sp.]|nr:hypothetical protein [Richelia sp.]